MDPYKILGLTEDASAEEIQKAYRKRAAKYHPDAGGDAWAFQQVQQAYETILNDRGSGDRAPSQPTPPPPGKKTAAPKKTATKTAGASFYRQATPKSTPEPNPVQWLRHLLTGELPLQNEVTLFILVGVLDIFMTYVLLRLGAVEANPFARFFLVRWGFNGLIAFKMTSIALVTVLAQVVAQFKMSTAKKLLGYGTLIVGIVVAYSVSLIAKFI